VMRVARRVGIFKKGRIWAWGRLKMGIEKKKISNTRQKEARTISPQDN